MAENQQEVHHLIIALPWLQVLGNAEVPLQRTNLLPAIPHIMPIEAKAGKSDKLHGRHIDGMGRGFLSLWRALLHQQFALLTEYKAVHCSVLQALGMHNAPFLLPNFLVAVIYDVKELLFVISSQGLG